MIQLPPISTRTDNSFPTRRSYDLQYAMDDFGDDYSSMQRLIRYPWDYCKFDANKIINLHDFGAVLYCVHNQIEIVAERVENQTLAESVKSLGRSDEHTSELQSLMRISYAVFCLKHKKTQSI